MNMLNSSIEPFYFGSASKPLFGCYHPSVGIPGPPCGVVLCYPMGEEYIRFHRTYRQIALQLTQKGFPVLRFDFYGCGDSSGECTEGRLTQWLTDVSEAIAQIRRKSGVARVCLVGLRLGATLALMTGAARGDIDGLVLWDPVIQGKVYMQELVGLHQEMLRYAHVVASEPLRTEQPTEILGFPLTDSLYTELVHLDLLATLRKRPAQHILLLESHTKVSQRPLFTHLKHLMDTSPTYHHFPSPQLWMWQESFGKIRVSHQILQTVIGWISEVYS